MVEGFLLEPSTSPHTGVLAFEGFYGGLFPLFWELEAGSAVAQLQFLFFSFIVEVGGWLGSCSTARYPLECRLIVLSERSDLHFYQIYFSCLRLLRVRFCRGTGAFRVLSARDWGTLVSQSGCSSLYCCNTSCAPSSSCSLNH